MGITFTIQGMALLAIGNIVDAEHFLQRSFDVLGEIQPITQTTYHHPMLGIVSLNLNKPDQAKKHIWNGLNIGMQISSAMVHLYSLGAAALYLAEQGNLEGAVEIYALASRYPEIANSQWQKDVVEGPLNKLVASLPPDIAAQAQQRGHPEVYLHAQTRALEFYERQGFVAEGDEFDEAGIPHRLMRRIL